MSPNTLENRLAPALLSALQAAVSSVVRIDRDVLEPVLVAFVAGGHVLIDGVPGTGKTLLARTLSRTVGGTFHRIQFTNDLMPSDIVGANVWRPATESFEFVAGPLFANFVLADEINRTSPRTLSCLLEAMENGRVSVERASYELAEPFCVLATRNPVEFHGTFPMPEAALDRFLVRVELAYPDADDELALYLGETPEGRLRGLAPVIGLAELRATIARVDTIRVSEPVARYCYAVVDRTRQSEDFVLGASPRAAMFWLRAARARALLTGREHVLPDDLKTLAEPVLVHRLVARGGGDARAILRELLAETPVEL